MFSNDFARNVHRRLQDDHFMFVGGEHIEIGPIAKTTPTSTAKEGIEFLKDKIVAPFGSPPNVISDNATLFTAKALSEINKLPNITWKTLIAYAPMSNGRAERMSDIQTKSMTKSISECPEPWDDVLQNLLSGDRRLHLKNGPSPFQLLCGVPPRMSRDDLSCRVISSGDSHLWEELESVLRRSATPALIHSKAQRAAEDKLLHV